MSISTLAIEARESLKDEKQLVQAFEVFSIILKRLLSVPIVFFWLPKTKKLLVI